MYMGGYWLVGRYQQHALKKEMQMRIRLTVSPGETEQFIFTLEEGQPSEPTFSWVDKNEFHYLGEMYDVIEKKTVDGKLYITCIIDNKEQSLLNQLIEITKKQNGKPEKTNPTVQLILSMVFVNPGSFTMPSLTSKNIIPADKYKTSLRQISIEVITPPPQA